MRIDCNTYSLYGPVFTIEQGQKLYDIVETSIINRGGALSYLPPRSQVRTSDASSSGSSTHSEVATPDDIAPSYPVPVGLRAKQHYRNGLGSSLTLSPNDLGFSYMHAPTSPFTNQMSLSPMMAPHINSPVMGYGNMNVTPNMHYAMASQPQTSYDVLAREFGVQPDLVAALAQRLAMSGPVTPNGIAGLLYSNAHF